MNSPPDRQPGIWLVIGDKLGDNAQAGLVADSLGLTYEIKRLKPKPDYIHGKPRFRVSLDHFDLQSSDQLQAPWPDLVITIGRRHAMAALWIKKQSPGTRIVLLGRPRRWIEKFDLVITLPQYRLPPLDNVMRLAWPLMRVDKAAVEQAAHTWADDINSMARPVTAVFVGGPTQPFRFDAKVTRALIRAATTAQGRQGSLFFVTSPRTTAEIAATLKTGLPETVRLHLWSKGDQKNPYKALLGLADRCIVTGDSVSMMIEAADLAKPLAIFKLPSHVRGRLWQGLTKRLSDPEDKHTMSARLGKLLYKTGITGFPRDLTRIHESLVNSGLATYLAKGFSTPTTSLPSELPRIRERIYSFLKRH